MSDTHVSAVIPRAGTPAGAGPAHEPAPRESPMTATSPAGRRPGESATGSGSAHQAPHTAPAVPREVLLGHAPTEPGDLAGLREMVDSLGTQLDLLYAERDDAARELTVLRSTVSSLTEQLAECYALQERQAQLDGRSLADLVASSALASSREPAVRR